MMFPRLFLFVSAAGFALIGINTFFDPQKAMAGSELIISSASAFNEIRANYGGMHLGMSAMLLAAACKPQFRLAGLWLVLMFTGGLLVGRGVSVFLDGLPNAIMTYITLFEIGAVLLATLALIFENKK